MSSITIGYRLIDCWHMLALLIATKHNKVGSPWGARHRAAFSSAGAVPAAGPGATGAGGAERMGDRVILLSLA